MYFPILLENEHASTSPSAEEQGLTISFRRWSFSAKNGLSPSFNPLISPSRALIGSVTLPRCRTASSSLSSFTTVNNWRGIKPSALIGSRASSHTFSPFEADASASSSSQWLFTVTAACLCRCFKIQCVSYIDVLTVLQSPFVHWLCFSTYLQILFSWRNDKMRALARRQQIQIILRGEAKEGKTRRNAGDCTAELWTVWWQAMKHQLYRRLRCILIQ